MMAASFNAAEGEGAYSANKGGIELSSLPVIHINTKKSKCKKCKKSINNFEERKQYQKEKLKLMCSSRSSSPTVSGGHSANGGVDLSWNQTQSSSANSFRTASASANDKLVQPMQAQNTHNKYKPLEGKSNSNSSNKVTTSQENENTSLSAPTSAPALHAPTQKNNSVPSPSTQHSKRESSKTAELKRRLEMFTKIQRQHYEKRGLDGTTAAAAKNKKRKMVHPILSGRVGTFNTNGAMISQSTNNGEKKKNAIICIDIDEGIKRIKRPRCGMVKEKTCQSNGDMKDNASIRKEGSVCSTPGDFSKLTQVYSSDLSKLTHSLDDGRSKHVKSSELEKLKSPPEPPAPPPINTATFKVKSRSLSEVKVSSTASQSTAINSVNSKVVARQTQRELLSGSKLSPKQSTISSPSSYIPSEVHAIIQHPMTPHILNSTEAGNHERVNPSEAQTRIGQPKSPPSPSVSGGMGKTGIASTSAPSRTQREQSSSHEGNDLPEPELLSESQSKPSVSTLANVDGNRIAGAPLKHPYKNVLTTDQGERAGPERPLKISQKHLPKYPIGCPIWFNMSYSKPCSKYLNAEIGVVKAMSFDYDRNIHYKVERKCMGTSGLVRHETVTVSENELAFGYHCPVYVRMDDGPELSGKVTDIKPIIGDDGGIEQTTYSVLFTQDFRVRKEDGIAAERLRYQLSLQSLQLALKGKASSPKIQRMVAIRSNDRGEPVRNLDPPFIHEEVFGPTEDDSSLEAGSCSDDEDSGCTETKVEAPLKPRQECNHRTTGVRPTKSHNGYDVRVCFRNKQYCVGTYKFQADAALAYDLSSEYLGRPNFESNFPGKEDFKNALKNEANGKSVNISESYARVKKKVKELLAKHLPATNYAVSQKLKCNNTRKANENDELASDSESFNAETVNSSEDDEDTCYTETDEETQAKCRQDSSANHCDSDAWNPNTKCKYKGVKSAHGSYEARVKFGNKIYCFGTYKFMADAALAYDEGSTSMRNSNNRANFPSRDEYKKSIMSEAHASGKSVEADNHEAVLKK